MSEDRFLGKQVSYPQHYAPEMLVAVPRQLNREQYDLNENNLPFIGKDVWHAYEISFLTQKGLPVTGLLKLMYDANSTYLVESKSLKLYLNSFNMERIGVTVDEGLAEVHLRIKKDLTNLLKTIVEVEILHNDNAAPFDFNGYNILEHNKWAQQVQFDQFNEAPELLTPAESGKKTITVGSHLLRSNCKITHQPDWGSVYIQMTGDKQPDLIGLLQYIVSIRNENHFHEEICEMIYTRLWRIFQPRELAVTCIYTRRGGIDICPTRVSHQHLLPIHLCNSNKLSRKLLRQ